jgi:hypothetical protein
LVELPPVNVTGGLSGSEGNGTASNGTSSAGNGTSSSGNSTAGNGTTGGNSTSGEVNCCDYFEAGAGYEFSVCDGVGAIIRADLIGGDRDIFWATQSPADLLAPVWTDLNNLINNYCDQRSADLAASNSSGRSNSSSNTNLTYLIEHIDIPLAEWGQDLLVGVENLGVWIRRYAQYLGAASSFLSAYPGSNLIGLIETDLANIDPNLNLTNVTYAELVADSHVLYAQFISWYGAFFGTNGLI